MSSKKKKIAGLKLVVVPKPIRENVSRIENSNYNLFEVEDTSLEDDKEEEIEENEEEMEKFESELEIPFSSALKIQDYLEFKAARCIQRFVRGWLYRIKYRRKRLAAIKIQSEWRCFYGQRLYFRRYEDFLQRKIELHFYQAAQKIQAFWRGWWVRHHIHDHTCLMRLQLMAGEDLLYCVAFKLHHLLRTHQIPGVYSLRNTSALSKVEQLLASLKFRTYNQRSIQAVEKSRRVLETARKQHQKSTYGTKIPFPGPNLNKLVELKCEPLYTAKDADIRIAKILQMYHETNRDISKPSVLRKNLGKQSTGAKHLSKSTSFCSDIVNSMKKWKVVVENNVGVDPNILKKPQNVENFLTEINSKLSVLQENCYCRREFHDHIDKEKTRYFPAKGNISEKERDFVTVKSPAPAKSIVGIQSALHQNFSEHSIISRNVFTFDEVKVCTEKINIDREEPNIRTKHHATFFNFSEEEAANEFN